MFRARLALLVQSQRPLTFAAGFPFAIFSDSKYWSRDPERKSALQERERNLISLSLAVLSAARSFFLYFLTNRRRGTIKR